MKKIAPIKISSTKASLSKTKLILILAILIQLSFLVFSFTNKPYFTFFPWGAIHQAQGIDFYQVPNGAYAFLRQGKLSGETANGQAGYFFGNSNVYHPAFTLFVGGFLQLFSPQLAFIIWRIFNFLCKICLSLIIYQRFKKQTNKNVLAFALFVLLSNFPQALEMWNGQYHFLLDSAIVIFFLFIKNDIVASLALVVSLLVKPITLLWMPFLILQKKWRIVLISMTIFTSLSLPFYLNGSGEYYFHNLSQRIEQPFGGPPGIFTLDALLRHWQVLFYTNNSLLIKVIIITLLVVVQLKYKAKLWQILFAITSFYLLFYDLVFEYHYTTLGTMLALGVLTNKDLTSIGKKILIFLAIIPTPFFIMNLISYQVLEQQVSDIGWTIIVLARILPLIIFNIINLKEIMYSGKKSS